MYRVLVVEDNEVDAALVDGALNGEAPAAFRLDYADRLSDASRQLTDAKFDLVLLDLGLPDSQGLETLSVLRNRFPEASIVVLTGSNDNEMGVKAIRLGAQDYLNKNELDGNNLVRSVRWALQRTAHARERAELERMRDVAKLKSEFLRNVSHELGNPLTPMRIQLHMLDQGAFGPLNEAQATSISVLRRNYERLSCLIHEMLDVSRLQSGKLTLHHRPMDLWKAVRETVETLAPQAQQAGVALACTHEGPTDCEADANRIAQVLHNLVNNAIKFNRRGGRVDVRITATVDEARVTVQDTGFGLDDEQRRRLFRPFERVHGDGIGVRQGTGLGLYISRELIREHGGSIEVQSDGRDKGATFAFTIPRHHRTQAVNETQVAASSVHEAATVKRD